MQLWTQLARGRKYFASPAVRSGKRIEKAADITAACILDDFSFRALKDEMNLVPIMPDHWHDAFTKSVDMLFVEAFWRGSGGAWRGIAYDYNIKERELLRRIVLWCRRSGIPTVFWNKEDPSHFDEFIDLAVEFDHVLTTDAGCIERYRQAGKKAQVMQFAAQPSLHNPIEIYPQRIDKVCFAGSYIRLYPQRMRDFDVLAGALSDTGLDIFDRNLDRRDSRYAFPEPFVHHIQGTLKGDDILRAYKGYRFGLNMNSIKDSETMLARRVFELMACNTPVISNRSKALERMFPGMTICSDDPDEVRSKLLELRSDERAYDRLRLRALRLVMSEHTYRDRAEQIAQIVYGLAPSSRSRMVRCISFAQGAEAQKVQSTFDGQTCSRSELSFLSSEEQLRPLIKECVDRKELMAVLRPQDHYGKNYLLDMAMAYDYSDAAVVTKLSHFTGDSLIDDGHQYRWVEQVCPGAIVLDPSGMTEEAALSLLTGTTRGTGLKCLSLDEFNYAQDCPSDVDLSLVDV